MNDPYASSSTSKTSPSSTSPATADNYNLQEEPISTGKGVRVYDQPERSRLWMTMIGLALLVALILIAVMVAQFVF